MMTSVSAQAAMLPEELPERLPIMPLRNTVLYPELTVPLNVERENSKKLVDDVHAAKQWILVVAQKDKRIEKPQPQDLYDVGALGSVLQVNKQPDGSYQILVRAAHKGRLRDFQKSGDYWTAAFDVLAEDYESSAEIEAMAMNLRTQFQRLVQLLSLPEELSTLALNVEHPRHLVYVVAANLTLNVAERQSLLEIADNQTVLERVTFYLTRQLERMELGQQIQNKIKAGMDKRQREYFLREQMRAIQRELGEGEERNPEIVELSIKLDDLDMPQEARQAAEKEIERLARMSPASAEYNVSRNYLDWLLEMPWSNFTEDSLDVRMASEILDKDHFDLEKVKRRILEYLAVLQLKRDIKGPILCFVGPPGVGKTSLGQSIARSLGRKFLRISLGGLRDEAEIRGHRRTYVGALPGRIIQGLRRVGVKNPVFMLDEIDKLGMDFRGDPSSALLEVLDPEQNFAFSDHYLGVPFDLSSVIFIATANVLDPIPPALKDRMEVIEIPGYTEEEKLQIARDHLLLPQISNHGLTTEQVSITDAAILEIIRSHTREAGVRNLERNLAGICRAIAREVAEGRNEQVVIEPSEVATILGPARFLPELSTRSWGPGIATGLAWTPSGGDLIFIEALRTHGSGKLILTGHLGDVMKESATAALTYIRAHAADLGIAEESFEQSDIHVHVPAGGIPKDGPSAGVPLVTALASLMSNRPIRRDVAMTGEITLRGDILPVGGIKEKVLAARRAGIREVLIPQHNAKDLIDIAPHLREDMTFHEIQLISEALEFAIEPFVRIKD
ncbi:endopeptidase La [Desulfoferrobacter suflitae]|uniref:endopeptidase La n=1 Tax=Desulfoferrobacter suflitae TaxID=2865782 RepID=UPI002164AC48|nr:endopeptidase La [Desulfoferrobacter suflitae]MCK8603569.1 endopeptidase La [Desulfoferrobacter suflitae]